MVFVGGKKTGINQVKLSKVREGKGSEPGRKDSRVFVRGALVLQG